MPEHLMFDGPSFAEDMREQGIHVGMGSPPLCVVCGDPWPCTDADFDDSPHPDRYNEDGEDDHPRRSRQ